MARVNLKSPHKLVHCIHELKKKTLHFILFHCLAKSVICIFASYSSHNSNSPRKVLTGANLDQAVMLDEDCITGQVAVDDWDLTSMEVAGRDK